MIFGVLLVWPMYEPDPNNTIELIPAERLSETRPHTSFTARDGTELPLRFYPADDSDIVLIMVHGGGGYGVYMHDIATYLSANSVATVYAPDVRGYRYLPPSEADIAEKISNNLIARPIIIKTKQGLVSVI